MRLVWRGLANLRDEQSARMATNDSVKDPQRQNKTIQETGNVAPLHKLYKRSRMSREPFEFCGRLKVVGRKSEIDGPAE